MEDDFDVSAAVDDIGSGLGLGIPAPEDDDVELDVAAPAADPAAPAETPGTAAPATSTTPSDTPAAPTTPVDEAPKTWRKEASAVWANLPSEVKAEVLKREADIFQGIETYKTDAQYGKSIKSVVAPYEAVMRQFNVEPQQAIGNLLQTHYALTTGTKEQRVALLAKITKDYGLSPADLQPIDPANAPYVDPAVSALQQQLAAVQSRLSQADQRVQQEAAQAISKQVDTFASDPKNIYFNDVADDMAVLLNRGVVSTMQEAYEKAIWTNPVVRQKEIARTTAEANQKAAAEAKAKSDAAKLAMSANVRTRAKSGSAATTSESIDDTLAESLAKIKARH